MAETSAGTIYRFTLKDGASPDILKTLLTLVLKEAEILYGQARLKLETSYELLPKRAACVIEGGTECGEHLAKLLSGFLIRQVGEDGFRVDRLEKKQWKRST
ncbi:MAG: hypothetical protein WC728_03935 [Elusimicrobiota bacterium]